MQEIAELFSVLPDGPGPGDWGRTVDLNTQLDALGSDAKLCEIAAAIDS